MWGRKYHLHFTNLEMNMQQIEWHTQATFQSNSLNAIPDCIILSLRKMLVSWIKLIGLAFHELNKINRFSQKWYAWCFKELARMKSVLRCQIRPGESEVDDWPLEAAPSRLSPSIWERRLRNTALPSCCFLHGHQGERRSTSDASGTGPEGWGFSDYWLHREELAPGLHVGEQIQQRGIKPWDLITCPR